MKNFDKISYSTLHCARHAFKNKWYLNAYFLLHVYRQEIHMYRFICHRVYLYFVNQGIHVPIGSTYLDSRRLACIPPDFLEFNIGKSYRSSIFASSIKNSWDFPRFSESLQLYI